MYKDVPKHIFKCSNCRKEIAQALIIRPNDPEEWTITVKCCFCGDGSFPTKIKGHIQISGFHHEDPLGDDRVTPVTNILDIQTDYENKVHKVITRKA